MYRRPQPNPALAVRKARDQIEHLNHLTLDADLTAPQISEAVQALISMVERLPQAVEQLAGALERQGKLGTIRMDNGSDPTESCTEAINALAYAQADLDHTADSLRQAGHALWNMAHKDTE